MITRSGQRPFWVGLAIFCAVLVLPVLDFGCGKKDDTSNSNEYYSGPVTSTMKDEKPKRPDER